MIEDTAQGPRSSSTFALICLLLGVLSPSASAIVIYENDFEDDPVGTYTNANLAADWSPHIGNDGIDEGRVSITDDADAHGAKSLVVMYPEGLSSSGKSQWRMGLGAGYEELFLSYRVRFDEGFDFVRGGKLPGLCGGACNSGGNVPDGTDGWSARMMWRTNGSSGSPTNGDTANIVQYTYHKDQPSTFGHDMRWDDGTSGVWQEFESDRWYHLQHRVVMNTPGQDDGVIQAWLDGEMVLDVQDVHFRDTSLLKIEQLYFSTFFGGSSSVWEATKDEFAYFDDFVVSTEFIQTQQLPGDADGDGDVDGDDLIAVQANFGSTTPPPGDADGDGDVDGDDLIVVQANFGNTLSTAVPEPASVALLLAAAVASVRTRARA